jgi:hypothetical protein
VAGFLQQLLGLNARGRWESRDQAGLDSRRLFELARGGEEFAAIAGEFLRTLPWAEVDSIERVENGAQHELYSVHRSNLERDIASTVAAGWNGGGGPGQAVKMLFHGTSREAVESIVHADSEGFLPLLSGSTTGELWGVGTYFARDASYSDSYACRLASGQKQVRCGPGTKVSPRSKKDRAVVGRRLGIFAQPRLPPFLAAPGS